MNEGPQSHECQGNCLDLAVTGDSHNMHRGRRLAGEDSQQ